MGSFGSLSIGISGIYTSQKGLQTISHNIANAENPDYTRQRVDFNDSNIISRGNLKLGTGTDVTVIKQLRDEFLDDKLRTQVSKYGYWGQRNDIMSQVESIINETGEIDDKVTGGLANTMNDFWKSMEELGKNPSNLTVRGVFKERAEGFVTTVRHISNQLDTLEKNLNIRVEDIVKETNAISAEIADLNKQIVRKELSGTVANDYRDKRNGLIDRLSQIADISVSEDSKGSVTISISGKNIVSGETSNKLECKGNAAGSLTDVYWENDTDPINLGISGELLAVLEAIGTIGSRNETTTGGKQLQNAIPAMKKKLNELVKTIAIAINDQQKSGYTLDGIKGDNFFVSDPLEYETDENGDQIIKDGKPVIKVSHIDASNIKLNIKSLNDIAASKDSGSTGNGKNAEDMLKLRDSLLYSNKKLTIDDFYGDIISDLGISVQESNNMMEAHGKIILELDNKKQSISAVSLDEEMSNMLKFQHAFSASTRFINTVDEMLDVIINRMAV